jgi:hypothetical protein
MATALDIDRSVHVLLAAPQLHITGRMHNAADAPTGALDGIRIPNVTVDNFHIQTGKRPRIRCLSHQYSNGMTTIEQLPNNVVPQQAG